MNPFRRIILVAGLLVAGLSMAAIAQQPLIAPKTQEQKEVKQSENPKANKRDAFDRNDHSGMRKIEVRGYENDYNEQDGGDIEFDNEMNMDIDTEINEDIEMDMDMNIEQDLETEVDVEVESEVNIDIEAMESDIEININDDNEEIIQDEWDNVRFEKQKEKNNEKDIKDQVKTKTKVKTKDNDKSKGLVNVKPSH